MHLNENPASTHHSVVATSRSVCAFKKKEEKLEITMQQQLICSATAGGHHESHLLLCGYQTRASKLLKKLGGQLNYH